MMDKIKTTNQLNNVVLTSMQPIGDKNLHFAGKILTKYGVSRWTDHFMALVLRYYSSMHMETDEVERLQSPSVIKNYVNNINVYNRIVNWTGEKLQQLYQHDTRHAPALSESSADESESTYRERGRQHKHNVFTEQIISSPAWKGLLRLMDTQGKDITGKVQASDVFNDYLVHSSKSIAYNPMLRAVAEDSPGYRAEQGRIGLAIQELTLRNQALESSTEAAEKMQGSQEALKEGRELFSAKAPGEAGAFAKLSFESTSRLKAKTLTYPSVHRSLTGLSSEDQYVNTAALKGYLGKNKSEHNRLLLEERNKETAAMQDNHENYSAQDIYEDNAAKSHAGSKLIHKTLNGAGMSQSAIDNSLGNKISQKESLVLHKPIAGEAAAEEQKPQQNELYEKAAGGKALSTPKKTIALNNIDAKDISLLADRVFKILEKRIAIQKDRRGLL